MNNRPFSFSLSLFPFSFSQITPPFAVVAAVTFGGNDTLSLPAGRDFDGTANLRRVWIILTFVAKQPAVPIWQRQRFVSILVR